MSVVGRVRSNKEAGSCDVPDDKCVVCYRVQMNDIYCIVGQLIILVSCSFRCTLSLY